MVVDTLSGTEDSLRQDFEKRTDREALPSNRGKRSAAAVQQLSPAAKTASATGSESSYRSFTVAARKRGVDPEASTNEMLLTNRPLNCHTPPEVVRLCA
jgi:hypothetical protein